MKPSFLKLKYSEKQTIHFPLYIIHFLLWLLANISQNTTIYIEYVTIHCVRGM